MMYNSPLKEISTEKFPYKSPVVVKFESKIPRVNSSANKSANRNKSRFNTKTNIPSLNFANVG